MAKPESQAEVVEVTSQTEVYSQFHFGPVPSAQELHEYELIVPGAAKAIIESFTEQGDHRRRLESRGQLGGFAVVLAALGCGGFALWRGDSAAGAAIVCATLGGSALVWIVGGRSTGPPGE